MIEHYQHVGTAVQILQQRLERLRTWPHGVRLKPREPTFGVARRKIVDAEMKEPRAERHGPLERNRRPALGIDRLNLESGPDAVVIGQRDERRQIERVLYLRHLALHALPRADRRKHPPFP